jgi:hypothetical protein
MARLAYCRQAANLAFDQDLIRTHLARAGFVRCQFFEQQKTFDHGGTHAFLAFKDDPDPVKKLAVLSFRGTDVDDPKNLITDIKFPPVRWDVGGFVYDGFRDALAPVRPAITAALASLQCRTLFTGHSLGAALATLMASARKPAATFAFGSPRVGDSAFVSTLAGVSIQRYVDCCDAVTRVPPELLGYVHAGEEFYIDRKHIVHTGVTSAEISADRLRARVLYFLKYAWKWGNVFFRGFADHAPINYVLAVTANQKP